MSRKTIDVETLRIIANLELAYSSKYATAERREGVSAMLEAALSTTGNYKGFRYLDETEVENDVAGIKYDDQGGFTFDGCDTTRRHYH